jgi:predicted N-formylglutamate amidohydrolase
MGAMTGAAQRSTGGGMAEAGIGWPAVELVSPQARGPAVLVCEHASPFIPPDLPMGLAPGDALSHAVWDPGALLVASRMSARLDAPLVAGALSRLVYDCNRPPSSPEAIRDRSERISVPGNAALGAEERRVRVAGVHDPFHAAVAEVLGARPHAALVSVHSFTPVYDGVPREVELGFLQDPEGGGARLARAMLEGARMRWHAALDRPYDASDGVTYTLRRHARGRDAVMIEIRNDLIASPASARTMGDALADLLLEALAGLEVAA